VVEYWTGKEDALNKQDQGAWVKLPAGEVSGGSGGKSVQRLAEKADRSAVSAYLDDGVFEHLRHPR